MDPERKSTLYFLPYFLTIGFFLVSYTWIFATDHLVMILGSNDLVEMTRWQHSKGVLFVTVTGVLLFVTLRFSFLKIAKTRDTLSQSLEYTIRAMIRMVEIRDSYTAGHSERVAGYVRLLGNALGLSADQLKLVTRAAYLHDIGKIETPDTILLKPDHLTPYEISLIRQHSSTGFRILSNIPLYVDIPLIVKHHHERYDGRGYPDGLQGEEIPYYSRLLAVVDAFDAMTSNRVYRKSLSVQNALEEIHNGAGQQFDPEIAQTAVSVFSRSSEVQGIYGERSLLMEAERMSYYFRDKVTAHYTFDFLKFLGNNRELIRIQEAWIVTNYRNVPNQSDIDNLSAFINEIDLLDTGTLIIDIDPVTYCVLFFGNGQLVSRKASSESDPESAEPIETADQPPVPMQLRGFEEEAIMVDRVDQETFRNETLDQLLAV